MNYKNIIKGYDIITGSEVNSDIINYSRTGALKGQYLGFPELHENYTMAFPGVTDWTGSPDSGKSQMLQECLMNMSEFYGTKHLLYFPDVGSKDEIIADIIHKYTGKTFDKRYKNRVSEMDIFNAMPWVLEHFKILVRKDPKEKITPYAFWDLAVDLKTELGVQTASIDSWKDMNHANKFDADYKYLADVLSYRNHIADANSMHFHTIIHPLKTEKDNKGRRKPASPYELKGGPEWYDNGRAMITVHRPDGKENAVEIHFNKMKPRSIGQKGIKTIYFDTTRFRYYWLNDGDKVFASKEKIKIKKPLSIPYTDNEQDDLPF